MDIIENNVMPPKYNQVVIVNEMKNITQQTSVKMMLNKANMPKIVDKNSFIFLSVLIAS